MHVPRGLSISMMPVTASFLNNITFQIDGFIEASEDSDNWPLKYKGSSVLDFLTITDSINIHIKGNGTVQGHGYWWWFR